MRRTLLALVTAPMLFTIVGCLLADRQDGEDLFSQEGKLNLPGKSEQEVYYQTPYARTPILRVEDFTEHVALVEQCADHFRIKNLSAASTDVKWTARGMKESPPSTANSLKP